MKKLESLLESFDLGKTERTLYLTGLTFVEVGVGELVDKTGINRTTAYHALDTLKKKGFCHESKSGGKLMYTMTQPEYLLQMLTRRQAALETQKHELTELLEEFPEPRNEPTAVAVEKFDGLNGIKSAVDRALYCRNRKWRIVAPKSNFFSQMPEEYANYFMRTRSERGIQAKTLWEYPRGTHAKLDLHQLLMRRPRYLRPELSGQFTATIIQFDDKVLFIHSIGEKSAILITSEEIARTYAVMFDGLWESSTKPDEEL